MEILLQPSLIEKEHIPLLNFNREDVLIYAHDKQRRSDDLYKALILGNVYRRKVKIVFKSVQGIKKVETTIWGVTENNIILKNGITVPIKCIYEVKPY